MTFYLRDGVPTITWHGALEIALQRPIRIVGAVCCQTGCATIATKRQDWVGSSLVMCERHAAKAEQVAAAMGFSLKTERIEIEAAFDDPSAQRFALMELE